MPPLQSLSSEVLYLLRSASSPLLRQHSTGSETTNSFLIYRVSSLVGTPWIERRERKQHRSLESHMPLMCRLQAMVSDVDNPTIGLIHGRQDAFSRWPCTIAVRGRDFIDVNASLC